MKLIACPNCGKGNRDGVAKCIHCKYPLTDNQADIAFANDGNMFDSEAYKVYREAISLTLNEDYSEGLLLLQKAANLGCVDALIDIGNYYEQGFGVEQSDWTALQWYMQAANKNNAVALYLVGLFHSSGRVVTRDLHKAAKYFERSSDLGYCCGSSSLAILFDSVTPDFPTDYSKAFFLYQLSISRGNYDSTVQNNLAVLYMDGKGTEVNYQEAEKLLLDSIAQGNAQAAKNYEILKKGKPEKEHKKFVVHAVNQPQLLR